MLFPCAMRWPGLSHTGPVEAAEVQRHMHVHPTSKRTSRGHKTGGMNTRIRCKTD